MTVFKHFTDDRPTGWRVSGRRVSLERWFSLGMILLVVVGAAYVGYTVNTAPQQVFLFPFLPLAALILLNPVIGLYLIIPVGHLVPYWVRVPTPVFDSPLEVVALFTIGAGAASWALRRTVWPRSWLYVPLAISVLILAMAWILRHGPEADARLYIFLATLLPFFSVIWLIDSPRKARILLLSMILSLLVQVVAVWLIVLGGGSQSALIFRDKGVMNDWLQLFRGNANPATHLSFLFSLVLASLMLAPRKWQRGYLFLMALVVIGGLVLTTYRAVLVNLGVVVIAVAMFGPKRVHGRLFISTVLPAVLFVMVGLLAQYQPGVQYLVDRWQRTDVDQILSNGIWVDRLALLRHDLGIFIRFPLWGVGAITPYAHVSDGAWAGLVQGSELYVSAHSSIGMIAAEYGIVLLWAWVAVFVVTGWTLLRLHRRVRYSLDRALVVGMLGIWAIIVIQAVINNILFAVISMQTFWICMGLTVVWDEWLRRNPDARLVDWQW